MRHVEHTPARQENGRSSPACSAASSTVSPLRGILNEREGIILQPWAELYYSLYSSEDGFLRDVSVGGGIWTTWHSERTLATEDPQWFYEADYYPLI